ncbi:hypothetical protein ACHAWF_009014 [Thalassiosira exigua]
MGIFQRLRLTHSLSSQDGNADENRSQSHTISREITLASNSASGDDGDASRQGGEVDRGGTRSQSQQHGGQVWRSLTAPVAAVRSFIHGPSQAQRTVQGHASFYLVSATLVEDEPAEGGGRFSLSLTLTGVIDVRGDAVDTDAQPSPSPTFDPRPTLEIVQDRGFVCCGFDYMIMRVGLLFKVDLLLSLEPPKKSRELKSQDKTDGKCFIYVLIYGDTHTIAREISEITSSYLELIELMQNGTCNAALVYQSRVGTHLPVSEELFDKGGVKGTKLVTKEPISMVTRNTDSEWSVIVEWVLQALIYAEEQGLTKDVTLCQIGTNLTLKNAVDLDFMNAVYCVGNYGEQFSGSPYC